MDKIREEFETLTQFMEKISKKLNCLPDYTGDYQHIYKAIKSRDEEIKDLRGCNAVLSDYININLWNSSELHEEIKKLREALWMDKPYDLMSCLKQLTKGVDILLHRYDYDDTHWEMMQEAWKTATKALKDGE